MANTQINIGSNGTTTLATAGKYCDRNIDVNVAVPASGINPTGTKSITANGEHDVTNFAKANVNVPIPDGYIKPSGTKSITENGTHDVANYASASVNVPIPSGYIKPSGTKDITANGTHDVSSYASASVNVPIPSGYIKPSGSININENKTVDVSQYASAVVSVPTPAEKTVVRTLTLSADTTGANALITLLTNDAFIKEHYADEGFAVLMVGDTPATSAANVIHVLYQGNKNIGSSNVARYGFMYRSTSASAIGYAACSTKINGSGYGSQFRVASDGSLKQYLATGHIWKAGTYQIILTCTT